MVGARTLSQEGRFLVNQLLGVSDAGATTGKRLSPGTGFKGTEGSTATDAFTASAVSLFTHVGRKHLRARRLEKHALSPTHVTIKRFANVDQIK